MTHRHNTLFALLLMISLALNMSAKVPDKPTQKLLMWDYANVIDNYQEQQIEDSLEYFSRTTSNQIVVMTVTDEILEGLELQEFGVEVGRKWGVGYKGKDNGVVILIKPKTDSSRGRAHITTGYGAEGPLPDLLCSRIVDEEMIPHFKENDYASGVLAALKVIEPALQGDFDEAENLMGSDGSDVILAIIVLIMIMCFIIAASSKNDNNGNGNNTRTYTGGPIIFPGGFSSGRSSSGWGGGGFGGGGWGGFGGGSFGGGGGGGSW